MAELPNPPRTANEMFFDAMLRHQVGLLRVSGSIHREVIKLLDATEADVRRQVVDLVARGAGLESTSQLKRLEKTLRQLKKTREKAWRAAGDVWNQRITQVALREPAFVDAILKTVMPVDLGSSLPNARRLRAIVNSRPFEGRTLKQWAGNARRADINRIETQVKIGLSQGETGQQIARRVVGTVRLKGRNGVTEITRRNAIAITRTSTNAIANLARNEYHNENRDLIVAEVFLATLDERTTHVCAGFDGQRFQLNEGPMPPLHISCRSLRVAAIDDEFAALRPAVNSTQRQLLREFAEAEGIKAPATRKGLPRGTKGKFDKFARGRKRELTGQVPGVTTYQKFLEEAGTSFQNDYLGITKAKIFRQGVPLTGFVDPAGRPLSLDRLADMHRQAFIDAGLDPSLF